MSKDIVENTKIAAYFIWEYTKNDDALNLWYCSEEIALFLETSNYTNIEDVYCILRKEKTDLGYIEFVRNMAFYIYVYTDNDDVFLNWLTAEKLLYNEEWLESVINISKSYREIRGSSGNTLGIRLEKVRDYYQNV